MRPQGTDLDRVRGREPAALEAFFDQHFPRIYALSRHLLGDVHAAEDLTQEVFFRAYRALHQLDPARDPVPWLVAITYNACKDHWRSGAYRLGLRSRSLEAEASLAVNVRATQADPEHQALAAEAEKQVQAAIQQLAEPLRVAVLLHDYMGLSHEAIAAATGVSHAAARKRYSRALKELARHLGDRDP